MPYKYERPKPPTVLEKTVLPGTLSQMSREMREHITQPDGRKPLEYKLDDEHMCHPGDTVILYSDGSALLG